MRRKGLILVSVCLLAVSAAGAGTIVALWPMTAPCVQGPESRLRAAERALAQGLAKDAEAILKPLAESGDCRVHVLLGRTYAALKNNSLAILHFIKALQKDPDNLDSSRGLGRAYADLGLHDLALPYLERVAELDSNDAASWKSLAEVYGARHRPADAGRALTRTVQLNPADVTAMQELSELTAKQKPSLAPHQVRPTHSIPCMSSYADSRLESTRRRP